jgi:hypothetical protein
MSIVVRFTPASLTVAQYDESIRRLRESGGLPADGMDLHVCFGTDGRLVVSEIWDSREQWEVFGERLLPLLAAAGITPGTPEVFEVHNLIHR